MFRRPPRSTLSLHDALPISAARRTPQRRRRSARQAIERDHVFGRDRKSTRLNSSHANISYAVFCLKKKKKEIQSRTKKAKKIRMHTARRMYYHPELIENDNM